MPEFAACGASAVYRCVTSLTWHGTRHSKSNGSGGSRCLSGPGMTCLVSCERSQCYHERERESLSVNVPPRARWYRCICEKLEREHMCVM